MKLWILSSSLLILIVIVLRFLLKGRISFRMQYAIWLIVLLRLLIPFSVGRSPISVENIIPANEPTVIYPQQRIEPVVQPPAAEYSAEYSVAPLEPAEMITANTQTIAPRAIHPEQLLQMIWGIGFGIVLLSGIISDAIFQRKLRRSRIKYPDCKVDLPVYLVHWLSTPCLAGLFHPCIYLTEDAVTSPVCLRHVLAHEQTHYQHGDHFWAWMRLLALALHWYNPLVWAAAILSRRDAELACDEAVLRQLGDDERHSYGETLLSLSIPHLFRPLRLSTSMSESKKSLRERIIFIARSPKMKISVLCLFLILCVAAVGITFPGSARASFIEVDLQETLQEGAQEDVPSATVQPEYTQAEIRSEEKSSEYANNNDVEEPTFPVLPDVPNAEQQYQLLMDQHTKWEFNSAEYSPWWYTFTDLDHNGRMEVIVDSVPGSSHLTYSHCYEVNESLNGIKSCLTGNVNYAILQVQKELPCYYDASSGLYYYINEHSFNISGYMHHSITTEALCLHNGLIERISLSYKQVDYENYGSPDEVLTLLLKDGDGNIISEEEYNTLVERRFEGMEKSTLPLTWEKKWDSLPVPTPDPMKKLEEMPENILPPSMLASAAASTGRASTPIAITYHPLSVTIPVDGEIYFKAHADNADGVCWRFISPKGQEYSFMDTLKLHPGLKMNLQIYSEEFKEYRSQNSGNSPYSLIDGDQLTMSNVPASLNGWGIKAAFYGPNTVAETSVASLTVYEPVHVTEKLSNNDVLPEEPAATLEGSNRAYHIVINAYKEVLEGKIRENEFISVHDLPSSHIDFTLKDLDGNGIQELLLYYKHDKLNSLFDLYTLVDHIPTKIQLYGMRSYFLCKDNSILYTVSAGEYYNFYTIQRLNGDRLIDVGTTFEHSLRADNDRFYYQPGEVGTMPSDRSIHLSLEEYNSRLAEYRDSIYIPPLTSIDSVASETLESLTDSSSISESPLNLSSLPNDITNRAEAYPIPSNLPRVTKDPTDETVPVNGKCQFVTRYENAVLAEWHFVSPDGKHDIIYKDIWITFPTLTVINGNTKDLTLDTIPAELNGWRVYCRFRNEAGSVNSGSALITVQ